MDSELVDSQLSEKFEHLEFEVEKSDCHVLFANLELAEATQELVKAEQHVVDAKKRVEKRNGERLTAIENLGHLATS
jgi:hypothetical protein